MIFKRLYSSSLFILSCFEIAFALNDGLGERGRQFFHRISLFSNKYDKGNCDEQYDKCFNDDPPDEKITIRTFFLCKGGWLNDI